MKEIIGQGAKLFGRIVIVTIMTFFVCVSISVLCTAGFTHNTGYNAYVYETVDSEEPIEQYTFYNDDGEDTKKAEYEEKGYTVTTSNIRSEMSKTGNVVFLVVTQIFCLAILLSFVYPNLWHLGTKDSNLVRFKHQSEDKLKGLKIGLIATVPAIILWILFVACACGLWKNLPTALYRFIFCPYYSLIQVIFGSVSKAGDASVVQLVLLLVLNAIVPASAFGAYLLGYKDISLGERFVYKKEKGVK